MVVIDGSIVTVSHLGLISGLIDELKIVEIIDYNLPKKRKHTISPGIAVKALLLDCLGFVDRRLYIMPDYFEDIATERLLGPGIEPGHLNQYVFGETLDRIAEFGPTKLFNLVILVTLTFIDLGILCIHTTRHQCRSPVNTIPISIPDSFGSFVDIQRIIAMT